MNLSDYIWYVVPVFGAAILLQIIIALFYTKAKQKLAAENPDAAVVILKDNQFNILGFTTILNILSINGKPSPQIAVGLGKRGYYLQPGANILELQRITQRPGILNKWVRTTFDPQKVEVVAEAHKKYTIRYDKKSENFVFEEQNRK